MAKTYNTIGTFVSGNILTAVQMNQIGTNSNNYRVPPSVRLYMASSSRANGDSNISWSGSPVQWDTESPSDPMWAGGAATRITIRTAGIYLINAGVNWGASATGTLRTVNILKNGAFNAGNGSPLNQFNGAQVTTTLVIAGAVGDYFEAQTGQNTGGALTATELFFSATWIGQTS